VVVAKKVEKYLTKMLAWNLESGSLWPLARALWSFRIAAVVTSMGKLNRREPGSTKGFGGVMGIVDLSKLEQSHDL